MRKDRGFTLIELLVVMAIIAILAAILFPVFAKAKDTARTSSCASNLKQICIATFAYMNDNGDKFPLCAWAPPDELNPGYKVPGPWGDRIYSYIKSRNVTRCPSFVAVSKPYNMKQKPPYEALYWWSGYGMNVRDLSDFHDTKDLVNPDTWIGRPISMVKRPSHTAMFGESSYFYNSSISKYTRYYSIGIPNEMEARHAENSNFACVDGSVKCMSINRALKEIMYFYQDQK